jgi:hypothetical protein
MLTITLFGKIIIGLIAVAVIAVAYAAYCLDSFANAEDDVDDELGY